QSVSAAAAPQTLRLDGIGPLKLGMTRTAAVRTGWLSGRGTGCPLGGPPLPITYRLRGRAAPAGVTGTAQFEGGRLRVLSFSAGVRTAAGVTVGVTTPTQMVARYRARGFAAKASFSSTFQGTFVDVTRRGASVIGAFAEGKRVTSLALPAVPVCD
ncbi:MAG: hypothetical protein JWM31_1622, partial [Solirubrobacterales bacterium]|nr:hypothetical protein [Solirubrobacterales bacterium]